MIHSNGKKSIFSWLFSLILHVFIFFVLVYTTSYSLKRTTNSNIIDINLVSISTNTKPITRKIKSRKKILPKIRHKAKRHKKTGHIKKPVRKKKRIRLARKPPAKKPKIKINNNLINKIKERIRQEQKTKKIKLEKRVANILQSIKTSMNHVTNKGVTYQSLIKALIKRQWKINKYMLKKSNYTAIVKIVIAKSGRLILTNLKKGSGNAYFDKTCVDAVRAAAPFPPYKASNETIVEILLKCNVSPDKFD